MSDGIDMSGLTEFTQDLMNLASKKMPKETRKFLQKEGNKLRAITRKNAKQRVKKKTGNLIKGIKRGKVYKYEGEGLSVRVYNSSPHAHLIEDGHRLVSKSGKELGFVKGKRVFKDSAESFTSEFVDDCETFINDLLEGGLH